MSEALWIELRNGAAVPETLIPRVNRELFARHVLDVRRRDGRLAQLFGRPLADASVRLYAIIAYDGAGTLEACCCDVPNFDLRYPCISADWPAAQAFEREIAETFGITPIGHPWLKPLRYHDTLNAQPQPWGRFDPTKEFPGDYPFYRVEGEEVHEVAVGPVHAGIIEPGHFRFQCHGEEILHLEVVLGFQHRAIERLMLQQPQRGVYLAETIAGDTTIAHATAYCTALESLSAARMGLRAASIRGIALELERLANHAGDLGAMAGDVAFLPSASYLGRLRGEFLNLTAEICGSRFGRNLIRPGGVAFDIDDALAEKLQSRLRTLKKEVMDVVGLMFSQPSVLARLEGPGQLTALQCEELGVVGVAARACGVARDVRNDHPHGVFQFAHIPVATETTGDVYARGVVRWLEIERSIDFLIDVLANLAEGPTRLPPPALRPTMMGVGMAEGWRGEVMHVLFTDPDANVCFAKLKDPSLHNWFGLAQALRGVAISDFPLCNKSFNLSYAGHDL